MATNAKVIEQAYAAFGRGDIPAILAALDENVVWTSPRTLPHGGEFHGPVEVVKFFEAIGAAWDPLTLDIERVGEIGDDVVVGIVRADGTRRGGKPARYGAAHVFRVRGGKITSFREFVDSDAAID
jgi:ketosteroid isomerase-like protein